ncbi:hypothetical protein [Sulfitobacter sp. M23508]|uniref:hypothetical protein n=1 Tax=Sulfitobacter sp. M23508 TaxID=3368577 RepID=UPI0037453D8C
MKNRFRDRRGFDPALPLFLYILVSYIWALATVYQGTPVAFGYQNYFALSEVASLWYVPALQAFSLLVGIYIARGTRRRFLQGRLRFRWYSAPLFVGVISAFLAYTLLGALDAIGADNRTGEIERHLEGKTSQLFLAISTLLAIINLERRKLGRVSVFLVMICAALYAGVDGSRAAVIPPVLVAVYSVVRRNLWGTVLCGCFLLVIVGLMGAGRIAARGGGVDVVNLLATLWENDGIQLNYFFAFSYLHFFYALDNYFGNFGWADMLYSLAPAPSAIMPYSVDPSGWRIDVYRPVGAQASVFQLSILPYVVLHVAYGFIARRAKYIQSKSIVAFVSLLLVLSFAASFQYHLRSVQWFFWLAALTMFWAKRAPKAENR